VTGPAHLEDLNVSSFEAEEAEEDSPAEPTKPLGKVRSMLKWALIAFAGILTVNALFVSAYIALFIADGQGALSPDTGNSLLQMFQAAGPPLSIAFYVTFAAAIFYYLWFVFRAMSNVKKFSTRHVQGSPVGAIVWHFAPILSLVKPYQIMRQLWVRSHDPVRGEGQAPAVAGWWWILWLGASFAGSVAALQYQILNSAETDEALLMDMFYRTNGFIVAGDLAMIGSILFLLPVTRGIVEAQNAVDQAAEFSS
jgi:hypothetical protein